MGSSFLDSGAFAGCGSWDECAFGFCMTNRSWRVLLLCFGAFWFWSFGLGFHDMLHGIFLCQFSGGFLIWYLRELGLRALLILGFTGGLFVFLISVIMLYYYAKKPWEVDFRWRMFLSLVFGDWVSFLRFCWDCARFMEGLMFSAFYFVLKYCRTWQGNIKFISFHL